MIPSFFLSALVAGVAASPVAKVQTRSSAVPVGVGISSCTSGPGTIGLGFDDGPYAYTDDALDQLKAAGMRASWFLNGQNWDYIGNYKSTVQRMMDEGHQVGSHTWNHKDMQTLSKDDLVSQMTQVENWLLDNFGKRPTYVRPPYLSYNATTLKLLGDMGYHVIRCDVDTFDYNFSAADGSGAVSALLNVQKALDGGGSLVLAHDVWQATIKFLLPLMILEFQKRNLKVVPIAECLGDPVANWYETSPRAATTSAASSTATKATTTAATATGATTTAATATTAKTTAAVTSNTAKTTATPAPTTLKTTATTPATTAKTTTAAPAATTTAKPTNVVTGALSSLNSLLCRLNPRLSMCNDD